MSVEQVHIIRHGQTGFNSERRLQGALPVPLNDCGRRQSRLLAQYLRNWPIDALYTSPRTRAKETAEIIGNCLKRTVYEDERLAEIAFGEFEGHTFAEVAQLYPVAYEKWESGYRRYRVPGGESRLDVQLRMEAAWRDITESESGHTTAAIIGHSSAMMIFLASIFAFLPAKPVLNTSITTLKRFQDIWRIKSFAETPHLDKS